MNIASISPLTDNEQAKLDEYFFVVLIDQSECPYGNICTYTHTDKFI